MVREIFLFVLPELSERALLVGIGLLARVYH
jgi:hypothetical protein